VGNSWAKALVYAALLLSIFEASFQPLIGLDTDIWWHVAAGQRWFQHGLEGQDPFSFTHPNQKWVHIDWLYQVLVGWIYQNWGVAGLLAARSLCLLTGCLILLHLLRQRPLWIQSLLVYLTASIWCSSPGVRPAHLSMVAMAGWVWLLEQGRQGHTRALWWLPALTVLWFNFHVAALAGTLLVFLYSLGHVMESIRQRQPPQKIWLWIPWACLLANLINPLGWEMVYYPIHFLIVKSPWSQIILEVQAPGWDWPGTWQTRLLLLLAWPGALVALRQGKWVPLMVSLPITYLMLSTYRHQFQMCSCLLPWALPWPNREDGRGKWPLLTLCALFALRSLAALQVQAWDWNGLIRRETFSHSLAQIARQGKRGLRVFTDMNAGGFFLHQFQGQQKIFIDSRGDQVYNQPHFLSDYFEILQGGSKALQTLDRHGVEVVINNRLSTANSALFREVLPRSQDWKLVYADAVGELYARPGLASQLKAPRPPAYLVNYRRGLEHLGRQEWRRAEDFFQQSLLDYPQFSASHQGLSQAYLKQDRLDLATEHLAQACLFNPSDPSLLRAFGELGYQPNAWLSWLLPFKALGL
jgi:hypothetical protein